MDAEYVIGGRYVMNLVSQKTSSASSVDLRYQSLSPNNRIIGYDLARAVALLGMLLVNFSVLLGNGTSDPTWLDHLIEMIRGRAAATFVVLAGAGLSLLSKSVYLSKDRAAINAKRFTLLKRSLFLLVIGLFNFVLSPISDILHFYAVYIALGACLLTLSNRSLALLAFATIAVRFLVMTSFDFVKNWDFNTVADTGIGSLLGIIGHFLFNGCFPVVPWMAFVMVGMWIGRRDLSDRSFRKKLLLAGVGAVTIAESLSRVGMYLSSSAQHGHGLENLLPLFQIVSWDSIPLFMISAMGTALGVISLSTILADKYGNSRWIMPHIAAGQVTLSLYVAHIIVGTLFLKAVETLEMELVFFPLWGTMVFYTGAVLFAYYWMRRFGKGPLELLMRRFLVFRGPSKIPSLDVTGEKDFPILAG
jgi:uncharacterized membrane protein YeiB